MVSRGSTRRTVLGIVLVGALLITTGALITVKLVSSGRRRPAGPPCQATVGTASYPLDVDQAANATTIAAVGKRLGLPDHAVTIALAAAMQESELHNLSGGDLDSLGLFQQRPSQGWGTPGQIRIPSYAAGVFYQHLMRVPGWQSMPVTTAAQAVQRSAAPDAYAQWEPAARLLAEVFTGEAPAGLGCRFEASGGSANSALAQAISDELGEPAIGVVVAPPRGWTVASWLVAHAQQYRIRSVAFNGQKWTPAQRLWTADAHAGDQIQIA